MTAYHYTSNFYTSTFKVLAVLPMEGPQGLPDDGVHRGQDSGAGAG